MIGWWYQLFRFCYRWDAAWVQASKGNKQYMIDRGQYVLAHLPGHGAMKKQDALTMQALDFISTIAAEMRKPHGFG